MARVDEQSNNAAGMADWRRASIQIDDIYDRAVLPTRRELPVNNYTRMVEIMRGLPELCPELGAVDSVASTQIAAHIFDATGGKNSRRRAMDLWKSADRGDGGSTLLLRAWRDFVSAGWYVIGNDFDGSVIADVYHIDAAYTRFNTGPTTINGKTYTPDDAPLLYIDRNTVPILRDKNGRWSEAWWFMALPKTRREIKRAAGWWPSNIPLHRAYDLVRTITLARAVKNAQMTGEQVLKLAFVNVMPQALEDAERTSELKRAEAQGDADNNARATSARVSTTMLISDMSAKEVEIKEVVVREGMTVEEMISAGDNAQIQLCALYGVNPLDVNPRLSGAGGLNEGTKAKVADDLREGRLVERFVKSFLSGWNTWTTPRMTEGAFTFNDPRDEDRRIARMGQVVNTVSAARGANLIDDTQVAQILDWEEIFPPGVIRVADGAIETESEVENAELDDEQTPGAEFVTTGVVAVATSAPQPDAQTPAAAPADPSAVVADNIQQAALNGAQVSSLIQIIQAVSVGELAADSAREIIRNSFPTITTASIDTMVNAALAKVAPAPAPVVAKARAERVDVILSAAAERMFSDDSLADDAVGALMGYPVDKASRATILRVAPSRVADDPDTIDEVVGALEAFGKKFVDRLVMRAPKVSGKLARSIKYAVTGRGTTKPALEVYAGNAARPELVVRATNFGRRGFGPKDPAGVLAFPAGGDGADMVFTKHVGPAAGQGWIELAFEDVTDDYAQMLSIIGRAKATFMKVEDVKVANSPHIDGFVQGGKPKKAKRITA